MVIIICLAVLYLYLFSVPGTISAQIPLSHLLIQAYKPSSLYQYQPKTIVPIGNVLGVQSDQALNTNQTDSEPIAVGGDQKTLTIAILGDSMIDTLGDFSYLKKSLTQKYPNYTFNIINYGLGASNIEYGLYRLENDYDYQGTHHSSIISQKPDIIIIESFAYNNFGNVQAGFDRHWLALGAITTKIKEKLPQTKIILTSTISPNSVVFGNGAPGINYSAIEKIQQTKTIRLYLQNLINFSKSQNFILSDAYTSSMTSGDGNQLFINKTDHIHPSTLGGQFFMDKILETFANYKIID